MKYRLPSVDEGDIVWFTDLKFGNMMTGEVIEERRLYGYVKKVWDKNIIELCSFDGTCTNKTMFIDHYGQMWGKA